MVPKSKANSMFTPQFIILMVLLAWLLAVTFSFALNLAPLADLSTLAEMSLFNTALVAVSIFILLFIFRKSLSAALLRWALTLTLLVLSLLSICVSYSPAFLTACILLVLLTGCFALKGWNHDAYPQPYTGKSSKLCLWITTVATLCFFLFVSIWTVCRVNTFSSPTYDFGIFSQMFHNMKQSGLPMTTLERDELLSHFKVHVSPIYYLLLPFYCICPTPATLQVLQAALLASAVIPLWLLGKHHGLSPAVRTLICILLLLYPAFSGGTGYDIHENAFLTPLIFWLFYAADRRKNVLTGVFTILVLMVKEDAAVYTATIALFLLMRSILRKEFRKQSITATLMLAVSVLWFLCVTSYLQSSGDGVMTYRYNNFMYDGSTSLATVIKAVLLCPMKAVYECVDADKLQFIGFTLLPVIGLPFLTRRYERILLLIPYILVNLMSDYQYQHDIFFQYTFGSTAFLFYMVLVNVADLKSSNIRFSLLFAAAIVSLVFFLKTVVPVAVYYPQKYQSNYEYYQQQEDLLETVPDNAVVAASTYYTAHLSQRAYLYDIRYTTQETLLNCEYVVLSVNNEGCYKKYASENTSGYNNLVQLLKDNGFVLLSQLDGTLQIYQKV